MAAPAPRTVDAADRRDRTAAADGARAGPQGTAAALAVLAACGTAAGLLWLVLAGRRRG